MFSDVYAHNADTPAPVEVCMKNTQLEVNEQPVPQKYAMWPYE
jgi:hypothetical protein